MNEEEEQQKLFGGIYDSIEDSAIGKFFDLSGEKKATNLLYCFLQKNKQINLIKRLEQKK